LSNGCLLTGAFSSAGGGASVTVTKASSEMDAAFNTTSTSAVDVTNNLLTLPDISDGQAFIAASCDARVSQASTLYYYSMEIDGTIVAMRAPAADSGNFRYPTPVIFVNDSDGTVVQMQLHTQAGTAYVYEEAPTTAGGGGCSIQVMAVG